MPKKPVLFLGSDPPAVADLIASLRAQGLWTDAATPTTFTRKVEDAVRYFQGTHVGPDGGFLRADGVVGPATWWALAHPSGKAQRSGLEADVPDGTTPLRRKILEVALAEHKKGVVERPGGSNRGPEVDKYLPPAELVPGKQGPPWCCYFYSWVVRKALGSYPLGRRIGSCAIARATAGQRALWSPKSMPSEHPLPGDAFVINHGGGHGHIGFVLRVSEDGSLINTVEGNCGNRVKLGLRNLGDPEIVGFVDNAPSEAAAPFERGVVQTEDVGKMATR